jgi:hypothetical protein
MTTPLMQVLVGPGEEHNLVLGRQGFTTVDVILDNLFVAVGKVHPIILPKKVKKGLFLKN